MKISEQLQSQLDRLKKIGSFSISRPQKQELAELVKDIGAPELLNLDCGTCVRTAMHNLNNYLKQVDSVPILSMNTTHTVRMTMDKKPNEMTFNELRAKAKTNGFKATRKTTKSELIKFLSND